jgi:cell shape-determining protein MreC
MRRMHEELPRNAATRAKQAEVQRAADEPELLKLQRSSGNLAVAGLVQRDKHKAPPKPKAAEHKMIKARIIQVQVKDSHTYIGIASGTNQGVTEGMKGWVVRGDHRVVSFEVDKANAGTSYAYVEASIDEVNEAGNVELDSATAQPDWRKLGD